MTKILEIMLIVGLIAFALTVASEFFGLALDYLQGDKRTEEAGAGAHDRAGSRRKVRTLKTAKPSQLARPSQ
jgi:hypothetical protein